MASATSVMAIRRNYLGRTLHWLRVIGGNWRSHPSRQLRLNETLALGERRFIAVIEFERQKFLIAGTGNSVAMLTPLPNLETTNQNRTAALAREKENVQESRNDYEEVPTWEFVGSGSDMGMIRR